MNSEPYFFGNPPCDRTLTGPARFISPCSITILTPGCSMSVVPNTVAHSCALSIAYFSVTFMVASTLSSSGSTSAMLLPTLIDAAAVRSVESVIGIGQNRPLTIVMPAQTLFQSAWLMNPFSGVKPPMPSMIRSPFSRELTLTRGKPSASSRSAASASPSSNKGLSSPPPCGLTKAILKFPCRKGCTDCGTNAMPSGSWERYPLRGDKNNSNGLYAHCA